MTCREARRPRIMRPADDLLIVRYFTARVRGDPPALHRQQTYLDALRAHCGPRLEIVEGRFQMKNLCCRACKASWTQYLDAVRGEGDRRQPPELSHAAQRGYDHVCVDDRAAHPRSSTPRSSMQCDGLLSAGTGQRVGTRVAQDSVRCGRAGVRPVVVALDDDACRQHNSASGGGGLQDYEQRTGRATGAELPQRLVVHHDVGGLAAPEGPSFHWCHAADPWAMVRCPTVATRKVSGSMPAPSASAMPYRAVSRLGRPEDGARWPESRPPRRPAACPPDAALNGHPGRTAAPAVAVRRVALHR